jgi:hypothetical protein
MLTRLGEVTFQVLQVRSGDFYPSAQDGGTRTDQAVNLALAEMYVQGVSTRWVIEVLQRLLESLLARGLHGVKLIVADDHAGLKAEWAEVAVPESLTVFDFPAAHRVRLRTTRPYTYQPGTATTHPLPASSPTPIPACVWSRPFLPNSTTSETHKVYLNLNP